MLVLPLYKQLCHKQLSVRLGPLLGSGNDGECYSIVGDPNKVLKLSIIFDLPQNRMGVRFQRLQQALDYVIKHQPEAYARVYEQVYLGTSLIEEKKFILYSYLMEKLLKISEDETKVFHTILSHEDRGITKNYSSAKIEKILSGLSRGLDFDAEKIILFCDNIRKVPVAHLDMHNRNIMKNEIGIFKLVDLDKIELEK